MAERPNFGAAATAMFALSPASSKISPTRTISSFTVTELRNTGAAWAAVARAPARPKTKPIRTLRVIRQFLLDLRRALEHLVGGLDHLRIHLIGALGADEIGDLLDNVHVGGFQVALMNRADAGSTRNARRWVARGRRLRIEIVAQRREADFVGEGSQLHLADRLRLDLSGERHLHLAAGIDGDVDGV